MVIRALPTEVLTTNVYCATCLRTRRFLVRPTHLACETCSRRLDRVAPERTPGRTPARRTAPVPRLPARGLR